MDLKELISFLNSQKKNLSELLEIQDEERNSLIQNDYQGIESAVRKKELNLAEVQNLQKKITNAIKAASPESVSFNDFIETLRKEKDPALPRFISLDEEIKQLAGKITIRNLQNGILIEHSRRFIRNTMESLLGEQKLIDKKL